MLNKNVCPKCGQLYDLSLTNCPVCNTPAQVLPQNEQPVQRHRLTEVERRQRQQAQKREEAETRKREREARRAADAEEERQLEEEEERLWKERQRKKLEKRGLSDEEIDRQLQGGAAAEPEREERIEPVRSGRVPTAFSVVSIILLVLALAIGGSFLLWRAGLVSMPFFDALNSGAPLVQPKDAVCEGISLDPAQIELTAAGQTCELNAALLPAGYAGEISYSSSDESVAVVGALGTVTAVGPGTATVTASCEGFSASCQVTCSFTVEETPTEPVDLSDGLRLSVTDITFKEAGENTYIEITNLPAGTEVFWASSNEEVATVDEMGHIVAVGKGTCYITAVVNEHTESCIVRCNFDD